MTLHHCMQTPCPVCSSGATHTPTYTGSWNGGVCVTCGARYLGSHTCSPEDLERRVGELLALIAALRMVSPSMPQVPTDRTAGCPCRPENGGSGVCGCILGGPTITCSASS